MDVISGFNTYSYIIYIYIYVKKIVIYLTRSTEKSFGQLVINLQYNKQH